MAMTDGGDELRVNDRDVVENDEAGDRPISVVTKRRVERGSMSAITTQRAISTRQHSVDEEADPEVTFKKTSCCCEAVEQNDCHSLWNTDGVRTSFRLGSESRYWTQHTNKYTNIWTRNIHADHKQA